MNKRILMEVAGVTSNRLGTGIYALILREVGATRCMPIIIGNAEAQSIQCCLQHIIPIRPLTHDLMADMLTMLGGTLIEVYIYRLPDGIFAANISIDLGEKRQTIDARSSDAVALALRLDAPIYTSSELLDSAGFYPADSEQTQTADDTRKPETSPESESDEPEEEQDEELRLKILEMTVVTFNDDALLGLLDNAVARENYREAGIIKRELDRRNSSNHDAL